MIPIRDDNPHFLQPVTTLLLIAINVAVWILLQGMGNEPALSRSVCLYALVPGELLGIMPPGSELALGTGVPCLVGDAPAWHTILTSMFMHGGWLHLIGNMWFLWVFGNNVEDAMGHLRFAVFYLLCGIAAALLETALTPDPAIPMVGASGAVGGVLGAYIVLYPRVRVHMLLFVFVVGVPAVLVLGYWFLLQLLGGLVDLADVAFWAHVGGFIAGAILVFPFRNRTLVDRHPYHGWRLKSPYRNWQRVPRKSGWF